ncbi:MAG TPA: tetratricopeptide repeat protein [Xanthobacteraceae bacterium]|nr:tetratricopeptide repeat protein [Xanthobacteraceae bacterium]
MQQQLDILRRALELQNRGELGEAERLYNQVLAANPENFDALHLLGILCHQRGDSTRAVELLEAALKVNPNSAEALLNTGSVLGALGRHYESLTYFDRALEINAFLFPALVNRGKALNEIRRYDEALATLKKALAIKPGDGPAMFQCGFALRQLRRYPEALGYFQKVLELDPQDTWAMLNCGYALRELKRFPEALGYLKQILKLRPADLHLLRRCGVELFWLGEVDEALTCFRQILALSPDDADAHWEIALGRLSLGDFAEGWKEYEWRWKLEMPPSEKRHTALPLWNGEHVDGHLLAWAEQGIGDEILYGGMIPQLAPHAKTLTIEVDPRLVSLFARSFPGLAVIGNNGPPPADVTVQCPFPSLGRFLLPSRDALQQRRQAYLTADPEFTADLRKQLSPNGEKVIGVSWISKNPFVGGGKTAALSDFEPLLRLPGCRYIDLQYGDTADERQALRAATGIVVERLEEIDNFADLDGLASLIAACDLVVTVSNTTAHLAGALGQQTIVFVPVGKGRLWYWFTEGEDSPWYPRVRLKRQQPGQSWKELAQTAAADAAAALQIPAREMPVGK